MKLSEIFNLLQYGELFNVSISGEIDAPKGIRQEDYPALITHINMALTDLHTKFDLKEREVVIQQKDVLSFYTLDSKYAESNTTSTEPVKYIQDTIENPFQDDVIRINAIYDEVGYELPINDDNRDDSVYLPSYKTIQVPKPADENAMFIMYRANHINLDIALTDTNTEIDIPTYCVEALLTYVASRVHATRTSQESQALSVNLLAKYGMLCDQIEERNVLHNTSNNSNIKLGANGWV